MFTTFNKNKKGIWETVIVGEEHIQYAKKEAIKQFIQAKEALECYENERKDEGKEPLTVEEKVLFLTNLTSHFHFILESFVTAEYEKDKLNNLKNSTAFDIQLDKVINKRHEQYMGSK
jgi:hypothetical protein